MVAEEGVEVVGGWRAEAEAIRYVKSVPSRSPQWMAMADR